MRLLSTLLVFCSLGYAEVVYPGFGTIAHIADGGGIQMEFVLTNLDDTPSSYFLDFYDDNGKPLSLEASAGTGSGFSGTLPPHGSLIIRTAGTAANVKEGWATVATCTGTVSALATFRFSGGRWKGSEAVVPADTWVNNRFSLPFDQTDSAVIGLAMVNHTSYPIAVTVTFRGEDGSVIVTDTFNMESVHRSFVTTSSYPATVNKRGTIEINSTGTGYLSVLALRFSRSAVSSIPQFVSSKGALPNNNNAACWWY